MWHKRKNTISNPDRLLSTKVKFKCNGVEQTDFMVMKKVSGIYILSSYPNYNEEFIINMDAGKTYLGGVMIQNGKSIAFY